MLSDKIIISIQCHPRGAFRQKISKYFYTFPIAFCLVFSLSQKALPSTAWAFSESTSLRLSNAEDHARGEAHKKALDQHLKKEKGQSATERAEATGALNTSGQQLVTSHIANMQASDYAKTKTKLEVAYFVEKEELPLSKYPQLFKLEEKHGVDIGIGIGKIFGMSCNVFITHIAEAL